MVALCCASIAGFRDINFVGMRPSKISLPFHRILRKHTNKRRRSLKKIEKYMYYMYLCRTLPAAHGMSGSLYFLTAKPHWETRSQSIAEVSK